MNRARRRSNKAIRAVKAAPEPTGAEFDEVPVATLCQSIEMLMESLTRRGYPVIDFDNPAKTVKQVRFIGGKVYFLAEEGGIDEET